MVRVITSVLYRTKNIRNAYAEFVDVLNVYGILNPVPYSMALDFTFSAVCCVPAVAADVHNKWRGTDNIYFAICEVKLGSVLCS